eukprot:m.84991 g.84991  ORF g.84991 m.84991 type:complete len:289 (-) comp8723_c0_seq8:147-1013(-)
MHRIDHETRTFSIHKGMRKKGFHGHDKNSEEDDFNLAMAYSTPTTDVDLNGKETHWEDVKSGMFGFGTHKIETLNGFECPMYTLANVQLITRKRYEHLSPELKRWGKEIRALMKQGDMERAIKKLQIDPVPIDTVVRTKRPSLTYDEYEAMTAQDFQAWLSEPYNLKTSVKKFKSTLWMSEEFPLTIDRVTDVLSLFGDDQHIRNLVRFLQHKLPPGFPVKLEIPIFPTVTARVSFASYFTGKDVDETVVAIPKGYTLVESIDTLITVNTNASDDDVEVNGDNNSTFA